MKTLIFMLLFPLVLVSTTLAQQPSEVRTALPLMEYVGLETGSSVIETNKWVPSQSVQIGTNAFTIVNESRWDGLDRGFIRLGNPPFDIARYEVNNSGSQECARENWALRETCNSMPTIMYFGSYALNTMSNGVTIVRQRKLVNKRYPFEFGPTNDVKATCLYKNFEVRVTLESPIVDPAQLALALLRAGGVEIPEVPEEPPQRQGDEGAGGDTGADRTSRGTNPAGGVNIPDEPAEPPSTP